MITKLFPRTSIPGYFLSHNASVDETQQINKIESCVSIYLNLFNYLFLITKANYLFLITKVQDQRVSQLTTYAGF